MYILCDLKFDCNDFFFLDLLLGISSWNILVLKSKNIPIHLNVAADLEKHPRLFGYLLAWNMFGMVINIFTVMSFQFKKKYITLYNLV